MENNVKKKNKVLITLSIILAWLIWTTSLTFIFYNPIKTAITSSGVIDLIKESSEQNLSNSRKVDLVLYSLKGVETYSVYTPYYGSSVYHDTIEALIHTTDDNSLKNGYISLVNPETNLIGLTVGHGICYVNFCKKFLNSVELQNYSARKQIEDTLKLFDSIDKVVILVEGKELDSL